VKISNHQQLVSVSAEVNIRAGVDTVETIRLQKTCGLSSALLEVGSDRCVEKPEKGGRGVFWALHLLARWAITFCQSPTLDWYLEGSLEESEKAVRPYEVFARSLILQILQSSRSKEN
jgi:hypothetical protein